MRDTRAIGDLFLEILPLSIACALSPWAIVAVILMLASGRPSNAVYWLAGWTVSTFAIGVVMVLAMGEFAFSRSSGPGKAACVIQVLLGVLLVGFAARSWGRRPARTGRLPKEPRWMARIDGLRPFWAFLIGAFWINTALVIAAGVDTVRSNLANGQAVVVFAAFTAVTMSAQAAAILYAGLRPDDAGPRLERVRARIVRDQSGALALVALALAVWLGARGISGLRAS